MIKDLISVIVPVYNTGAYLEKCVNSILEQEYSEIEILIIDDGSNDEFTAKTCDKIISISSKISVYHKKNGGSASARNFGINKANGEYIAFVDSDDYIDRDMYSNLIYNLKDNNIDLALAAMHIHESNNEYYEYTNVQRGITDKKEIIHNFLLGLWHSSCTNLYKKEILENIQFPENEINEDFLFNYQVIKNVKNAWVDPSPYYHYMRRIGSNTSSNINWKILDWVKHNSYVSNDLITNFSSLELKEEIDYNTLRTFIVIANKSLLTYNISNEHKINNDIYFYAHQELKKNVFEIKNNKYLSLKNKAFGLIISFMPKIYKKLILCVINLKRICRKV